MRSETCALIEDAVGRGSIQPDARQHVAQLHRISNGIPRVLEQLLLELAARKYKINKSVGLNLLELDRRIHEFTRATFDPEQ